MGCRGYEVMAAPGAEKSLAWGERGRWGVHVPLHERSRLNSADKGPVAALEMVRDWILCKQNPFPSCMQTDPAAWSTVGLKYVEVG